mmetsp:Transcript_65432/g.182075  ORF Transcript_65432/g.182075 Transcript_65432/m.182075 type:complete len:267 (-) Transcript_65432:179-979(-)
MRSVLRAPRAPSAAASAWTPCRPLGGDRATTHAMPGVERALRARLGDAEALTQLASFRSLLADGSLKCSRPATAALEGSCCRCRGVLLATPRQQPEVTATVCLGLPESACLRPHRSDLAAELRGNLALFHPKAPQALAHLAHLPGVQLSTHGTPRRQLGHSVLDALQLPLRRSLPVQERFELGSVWFGHAPGRNAIARNQTARVTNQPGREAQRLSHQPRRGRRRLGVRIQVDSMDVQRRPGAGRRVVHRGSHQRHSGGRRSRGRR